MDLVTDDYKIVTNLISDFIKNFDDRNDKGMLKHFRQGSKVFGIGSAEKEIYNTFDQVVKLWSNENDPTGLAIENFQMVNLQIIGNVAWCALTMDLKIHESEAQLNYPVRLTIVWEQDNNGWFIRQTHGSFPQFIEEVGDGWPTIRGIERKIIDLIDEFNLNPNIRNDSKSVAIKKYLTKAKEIAASLSQS